MDKEKLVLCCSCEHARPDVDEDTRTATLVCCVDESKVCFIGPHCCEEYEEARIPF